MPEKLLELKKISKQFPGVKALSSVNFDLLAGEVHVLAGENGAGKSTLIKILSGNFIKDEGTINLYSDSGTVKNANISNAKAAQSMGIATIHQEFSLVLELTVAQNIFLGHEPKKNKIFIDWKKLYSDVEELLGRLGIKGLDPRMKASELSISQRQLVEIAKALSINSKIIIFDEPTGTLTSKDIDYLFSLIKRLKEQKIGIIYISHRMEEIKQIGDRITVLRDGHRINTYQVKDVDMSQIIFDMTKKKVERDYRDKGHKPGEKVIEVKNLNRKGVLDNISFTLHAGEVVGFYGLIGSGRTEIAKALFGLDPIDSGDVYIHNKKVKPHPTKSVKKGIAFIPEDRNLEGLCLNLTVRENLMHAAMPFIFKSKIIRSKQEKENAERIVKQLNVKTPSIERIVNYLSGGNKQKVVLGKWLLNKQQEIFIFDEPTRGIDVGAKSEFYKIINDLVVKSGAAVILISSEIPEILSMSDRIYVTRKGKIEKMFTKEEATEDNLLQTAIL